MHGMEVSHAVIDYHNHFSTTRLAFYIHPIAALAVLVYTCKLCSSALLLYKSKKQIGQLNYFLGKHFKSS